VGNRFTVEPGRLRSAGFQLGQEAQVLAGSLSRLQGRLGSLGDVSGDDHQGRAFAAGYQPKVELLEHALQQMVKGLEDMDAGLRLMADRYEGSDSASRLKGRPL
jgi:uncharacterized protein YukE